MAISSAALKEAAKTIEDFVDQNFAMMEDYARKVLDEKEVIRSNVSFAFDNTSGITVIGYCDDGQTYYVIPFEYFDDPEEWFRKCRERGEMV